MRYHSSVDRALIFSPPAYALANYHLLFAYVLGKYSFVFAYVLGHFLVNLPFYYVGVIDNVIRAL